MSEVDYKYWANYIKEIHTTLGNPDDLALELASGNCQLANHLKRHFGLLIVSDLSVEMLKNCKRQNKLVCCDMTKLPFNIMFDYIFTTFDSVNYLNTKEKLLQFFKSARNNLSVDGILTFDVSLKNNSIKYVDSLNRKGKHKGINYIQRSYYDEKNKIHTNDVTIILPNGEEFKEVHKQKIYDFYYYFEAIEMNDLYVLECFEAFTFNDANPESERVQFIVKRNS